MNYRHAYHAGNFADAFKHWILVLLLEKLTQKPTPFSVLDTHAGEGFYDLTTEKSQKTLEFKEGIERILHLQEVPTSFQSYLNLVKNYQGLSEDLVYYPGSPAIIQHFLRPQDSFIACEKHPETYQKLKKNFKNSNTHNSSATCIYSKQLNFGLGESKQIEGVYTQYMTEEERAFNNVHNSSAMSIHEQNGYEGIKAHLPFKERRGLVLIDPPFEKEEEFKHIIDSMKIALHRFHHGVYAIWYPIKHRHPVRQFLQQMVKLAPEKILIAELLRCNDNDAQTLNGCGMVLINPPYQLKEILAQDLPWLANHFAIDDNAKGTVQEGNLYDR